MLVMFTSQTKIILINILTNKLRLPTPFSLFCTCVFTISYDMEDKMLTHIVHCICTRYFRFEVLKTIKCTFFWGVTPSKNTIQQLGTL